jgi:hypothetical protein
MKVVGFTEDHVIVVFENDWHGIGLLVLRTTTVYSRILLLCMPIAIHSGQVSAIYCACRQNSDEWHRYR